MKAYTDLQQSRKLAEILSIESADMHYVLIDSGSKKYDAGLGKYIGILPSYPCWSLAALLYVLPKIHYLKPILDLEENSIQYSGTDLYVVDNNPIDACYEMILKLYELKVL